MNQSFTYSRDPDEMRNRVVKQKVAVACSVFLHPKAGEQRAIWTKVEYSPSSTQNPGDTYHQANIFSSVNTLDSSNVVHFSEENEKNMSSMCYLLIYLREIHTQNDIIQWSINAILTTSVEKKKKHSLFISLFMYTVGQVVLKNIHGYATFTFLWFLFCFAWLQGAACRILVSGPGVMPPAVEAQSLNHWTAREVPQHSLSKKEWSLINVLMNDNYSLSAVSLWMIRKWAVRQSGNRMTGFYILKLTKISIWKLHLYHLLF